MADLHFPDLFIGVAFNAEPFDVAAVPTWSDLTARARAIGSANRGRQYELDQNQTGAMDVSWVNIDEALNPANAGSPYYPNVQPYRAILARCMWPNGGTGNLVNLAYNGTDGSFESYAIGPAPAWLTAVGAVVPTVTATTPFQGTQCVTYAVAAGATIRGLSWVVPCIPGRQYTASGYVRQTSASTQQISVVGVAAGTSTTTTGAYVRLTVTFTATQPTHTVQMATVGTAIVGTALLDALQLDPGAAATAFTTVGPLIRNFWTRGYVERWPPQWDETGFEGRTTTPCVGPLAILQNANLHTEVRLSILAKAPRYYWPLTEPEGAAQFGEASGNNGPPMVPRKGKYGPGAGLTAGVESAIVGDIAGSGVQMFRDTTHSAFSSLQQSTILSVGHVGTTPLAAQPPAPFTAWAGAWSLWINCIDVGDYQIVLVQGNPQIFLLTVLPGSGFLEYKLVGSSSTAFATTTVSVTDGKWHHIVMNGSQVSGGNTIIQIYIDGVVAASTTALTATVGLPNFTATGFQLGGYTTTGPVVNGAWSGIVTQAAGWYRVLTPAEIADLWAAGGGYVGGELESTRIARYLAGAGYTGPASIGTGASVMGPATVREDDAALGAIQHVADSAFGNFYESAEGVAYASRNVRYLTTSSAYTFGENVAGGEYPYVGDISFDFDPTLVLNIADVTRNGGIVGHAEDPTGFSPKRYGRKNFTRTIDIASDNETQDAATWVVANRKSTQMRVAAVTFDPAATRVPFGDGTLWPLILTLEIGTRVTVKRRPKAANGGVGITMSGEFFVERLDHHDIDFEAGTWLTTVQLSPVNIAQPWILQDAVYGQLDVTAVLGF